MTATIYSLPEYRERKRRRERATLHPRRVESARKQREAWDEEVVQRLRTRPWGSLEQAGQASRADR